MIISSCYIYLIHWGNRVNYVVIMILGRLRLLCWIRVIVWCLLIGRWICMLGGCWVRVGLRLGMESVWGRWIMLGGRWCWRVGRGRNMGPFTSICQWKRHSSSITPKSTHSPWTPKPSATLFTPTSTSWATPCPQSSPSTPSNKHHK